MIQLQGGIVWGCGFTGADFPYVGQLAKTDVECFADMLMQRR
ncbi:MAG: hypothetical protein PHH90_03255 [Limnochordia bacterium]|nr:hypothetical protein [Limnochordia bacterium]